MKNTRKPRKPASAEAIARLADQGRDVSCFFTNAGRTMGLTLKQKRELAVLAALPDEQIDTSDAPELPPNAWKDAVRGRYRPRS